MPPKKFVFRLQVLLEHKERIEDEKKQAFGKVIQRLSHLESELQGRMNELQTMWSEKKEQGFLGAEASMVHLAYTGLLKEKIYEKKAEVEEYKKEVEKARLELVEAARERKALEILKEKQKEEFKKAEKVKEIKLLDDLASSRAQRSNLS